MPSKTRSFDVVGLGALNYDYVVLGGPPVEDSESVLPKEQVFAELEAAGGTRAQPRCGGSAYSAIRALRQIADLRVAMVGITPRSSVPSTANHVDEMTAAQVEFLGTRNEYEAGICGSLASPTGRRLLVDPRGNARIGQVLNAKTLARIRGARVLHVSSLLEEPDIDGFPVATAVADFLATFRDQNPDSLITLDPGYPWASAARGGSQPVLRIFAHVDLLFLNDREYLTLAGGSPESRHSALALRSVAPRAAVHVFKDLRGIRLLHASGLTSFSARRIGDVQTIDPTGAGDAVAAGVLASIAENRTLEEGARLGLRIAATVVGRSGPERSANLRKAVGDLWTEQGAVEDASRSPTGSASPWRPTLIGLGTAVVGGVGLTSALGPVGIAAGVAVGGLAFIFDALFLKRQIPREARLSLFVVTLLATFCAALFGLGIRDSAIKHASYSFVVTNRAGLVTPLKSVPSEGAQLDVVLSTGTHVSVLCQAESEGRKWYKLADNRGWLREDEAGPEPFSGEEPPPQCPS